MVGGRHFSLHWQHKNCFLLSGVYAGLIFFGVTCKQKLAKTDIFADCHQSDAIDLAWFGENLNIWNCQVMACDDFSLLLTCHARRCAQTPRFFSLQLGADFQKVPAHAAERDSKTCRRMQLDGLNYFCLIYLASHNHGNGKWLYLKGNYYWRGPFLISMIMGGSVV